jgi:hypothetical protein
MYVYTKGWCTLDSKGKEEREEQTKINSVGGELDHPFNERPLASLLHRISPSGYSVTTAMG